MLLFSPLILLLSSIRFAFPAVIQHGKVHELYANNLTSNLFDWEMDMAIMFYNPGCKYCKQLLPSWQAIATATKQKKDLVLGKFNCHQPLEHNELCNKFGVDRYPSVYFIGYGNYNQAPPNNPLGKTRHPSLVRYTADLYPEAIYDWILMLNGMSWFKRKWTDWTSIFTGKYSKNRDLQKWLTMKKQLETLERKVKLFSNELEKYKALELFDSLDDFGDPFPLLHSLPPDEVSTTISTTVSLVSTIIVILVSKIYLFEYV